MKRIFFLLLLIHSFGANSQAFFSRVYTVPEDGTGLINLWPNYLSAVFTTDTLIYAFGYSADTTYREIYGTAFFVFNQEGDLLEYYHIKDSEKYNFFEADGIYTWDGITFYTAFNNHFREESILKFNRHTKEQKVLEIKNSVISNGDILRGNMIGTINGCLITASEIASDSTGYNYKIQVTKIDTSGKIKWQTIVGKEPVHDFNNYCNSAYSDKFGNIFVGVGYNDPAGRGTKADYQSLFYKLDSSGALKKVYCSQIGREGFNKIYDISQDANECFFLSSDYNWNESQYPYANRGYGALQILDTNLNYKYSIKLDLDSFNDGPAWTKIFEKIIKSNDDKGFIVGGTQIHRDTLITFIDSLNKFDTIKRLTFSLNLLKLNNSNQIEWRRIYRIRNEADRGYLHDLKSHPKGGYVIGAESYDGYAESKNEPFFMPWLLRVDDDGCLIPGCGTVSNKNLGLKKEIIIYPNPASNYITLLHSSAERTHYQIVSVDGIIMDAFSSYFTDEQIIIPLSKYAPGSYIIKASNNYTCIGSKIFMKE